MNSLSQEPAENLRELLQLVPDAIIPVWLTPRPIPARSAVFRRSFRKNFPAAVRGEGVYIWDADGNQYLDLSGSAAVNFIGHGVPEISAAMAEQAAKLEFVHTSQFTTPVAEEYAKNCSPSQENTFAAAPSTSPAAAPNRSRPR